MSYKKNLLFFIILVFPAIFFRFFTSIYPNISTLYLSLTDTNLMDGTSNFIGLKNYFRLYYNKNNLIILNFTLFFVLSSLFFQLTFGFLISLLLNRESKIKNTLRTFSLLPWALPMIVVAYAFHWMLDDQFGLISIFYSFVDEKPLIFLDPLYSKITVILINIWKTMPFVAIVFLAGLQGIQKEVIDAAKVDGASNINIALKIILPSLLPIITILSIFLFVGQIGSFDLIYGLTKGGPGISTQILAMQIFQDGMLFFKFGLAAAESVILLFIVVVFSLLGLKLYSIAEFKT